MILWAFINIPITMIVQVQRLFRRRKKPSKLELCKADFEGLKREICACTTPVCINACSIEIDHFTHYYDAFVDPATVTEYTGKLLDLLTRKKRYLLTAIRHQN
jgi:hypothetical protein